MCLVALFFRVVEDAPVVVGANREELYSRGGEPPRLLDGFCRAAAGIDPVAGGTWLGVNEHGLLVAVTNRPRTKSPPQPRSRGLLVRDLLACPDVRAAVELGSRELSGGRYAGCNVLCVNREAAYVLHAGDRLRVQLLPSGLHVLTAADLDDPGDRRLGYALEWLHQRGYQTADDAVAALKDLCSQRGNGSPPICLRGEQGGTVSSSILALRQPPAPSLYLHAQGPPDRTPYQDYSFLLEELQKPTPCNGWA